MFQGDHHDQKHLGEQPVNLRFALFGLFQFGWGSSAASKLLRHGADIHDFILPDEEGLSEVSVILRNLEEGRELLEGLYGLDPDSDAFKPYTMKYRGKEKVVQPCYSVEDYRQQYEIKWRELEPVLRACYKAH